jgi:Rps23 Pro-64 3,4-dihydroxylase Tpa1-like proline 4-hydroxylase
MYESYNLAWMFMQYATTIPLILIAATLLVREASSSFSVAPTWCTQNPAPSTTTSSVVLFSTSGTKLFSDSVYDTIQNGKIAVVHDFFSAPEIDVLRRDATDLYINQHYTTDALASYGTSGSFDPSKDRAVLKLQQWKNTALGDWGTRRQFAARIHDLRSDLAVHLNRPALTRGDSVTQFGEGSTEMSYTRFGPGAFLKRHVDEHHEELKGVAGWAQPTRRSLSWLVYLNDQNWSAERDGGCLRCFERPVPPSHHVGARENGDLQIGWLRATLSDPVERPVFLDAQHAPGTGNCAMYIDDPSTGTENTRKIMHITKDFNAHPVLFVAGGEYLTQKFLVGRRDFAERFHLIEPPKSRLNDILANRRSRSDEVLEDVTPTGGTLVIFDSVSLPHEVLPTTSRERWATSGWMHEDQQRIVTHPECRRNNLVGSAMTPKISSSN